MTSGFLSSGASPEGALDFEGAVLAGGASQRMGRDKAFVEIDGVSLLQGAVTALQTAGASSVIVVGGDARTVESLGFVHVEDVWPKAGPLGGIITALRNTSAERVAILSCDLIGASATAIGAALEALGDADVAVPVLGGQAEWLHAVWRRSALQALERSFSAGERAPKRAVSELQINELLDGDPRWFHDADYPSDLPNGAQ